MPLAIYGLVLIVAMIAWPTGIQGAIASTATRLRLRGARPLKAAELLAGRRRGRSGAHKDPAQAGPLQRRKERA